MAGMDSQRDAAEGIFATDLSLTLTHPRDGKTEDENKYIDVGKGRVIDKENAGLIERIKNSGILAIASTGMSKTSYDQVDEIVKFDYAALEHGSVIYSRSRDGTLKKDEGWEERLKGEVQIINDFRSCLIQEKVPGELIDYEGRESSFKIKPDKNAGYSMDRVINETLSEDKAGYTPRIVYYNGKKHQIWLPEGAEPFIYNIYPPPARDRDVSSKSAGKGSSLGYVRAQDRIDIIPKSAGKGSSLDYIRTEIEQELKNKKLMAAGDDLNDQSMFDLADFVATFSPSLLMEYGRIGDANSFITKKRKHEGTGDILRYVLNNKDRIFNYLGVE